MVIRNSYNNSQEESILTSPNHQPVANRRIINEYYQVESPVLQRSKLSFHYESPQKSLNGSQASQAKSIDRPAGSSRMAITFHRPPQIISQPQPSIKHAKVAIPRHVPSRSFFPESETRSISIDSRSYLNNSTKLENRMQMAYVNQKPSPDTNYRN